MVSFSRLVLGALAVLASVASQEQYIVDVGPTLSIVFLDFVFVGFGACEWC